jgi:hypothetical protein
VRVLLGAALLIHGVAHVVGFVVPWRIVTSPEVPYRTTVFGVDVGAVGVRALGIVWLFTAMLFVALAASVLRRQAWPLAAALTLVGGSVALCVLGLPESRPGLLANAAILALLAVGWFMGTYPEMQTWTGR